MSALLSIGEFSKMTYLSVKALRHYHDVGLLEPADVDPATGYRLYSTAQVGTAQAIRRFRELDMPIEQVRAVLEAPNVATRNRAILEHLERMQQQLERTQTTVASLHALLEDVRTPGTVEYRTIGTTRSLAIADTVPFEDSEAWCSTVFGELHDAVASAGLAPAGPDGALYFSEFFEAGSGKVVAFIPIVGRAGGASPPGRTQLYDIPAVDVAVMLHEGPFADLDQTYGDLGTFVAERGIGVDGPIREHYLADPTNPDRTEVCWPITPR